MTKSKFLSLDTKIQQLKKTTNGLKLRDICNNLFMMLIKFGRFYETVELHSPSRQTLYLLGILASKKQTKEDKNCSDDCMKKINSLLNEIFGKYLNAYLPTTKEMVGELEWLKNRDISAFSFLSYFFESPKIATEQIRLEILRSFEKFNTELKAITGLNVDEAVGIADAIGDLLQKNIDEISTLIKETEELRVKILSTPNIEHSSIDVEIINKCKAVMAEAFEKMNYVSCFKLDLLEEKFTPDAIQSFKNLFVIKKGESVEIHYITDENPVLSSPILTEDNDLFYLCSINYLYLAIQINFENSLKQTSISEKFRKHRDMLLEKDSAEMFREFLPKDALIFESVFENNKSTHEHDLLILHERVAIIVESKASPRREPLRDPERAFKRISDDFKKKSGIQSGYDQARKLEKLLERKDITPLYTKKGDLLVEIDGRNIDEIYSICITKDDFGVLATNLTLLLDKEDEAKYPLVINISDLKYLLDCLKYVGKDWSFFVTYLRERRLVHGKILSADELEFAGAFLKYGTLFFTEEIHDRHTKIALDINESNIFDDIHFAQLEGVKFEVPSISPPYEIFNKNKFINKFKHSQKDKEHKKENRRSFKHARRKNRK